MNINITTTRTLLEYVVILCITYHSSLERLSFFYTKGSSGLTELNTGCDVRIEKVGCYRDNMNPRPLSILVINDREGKSINWTQFEEYVNG